MLNNQNDKDLENKENQQPDADNCVQEEAAGTNEHHTTVKNAHATGMGAIGRSEEKIEDTTKTSDTGKKNVY